MVVWPFQIEFLAGRQRPTPDQLSVLAVGTLCLILPFFLHPSPSMLGTHTQLLLLPCAFYRLTAVPCASCGMTTSFAYLAHGRLIQAFIAHPLGALAYLYLATLVLAAAAGTLLRRAVVIKLHASPRQLVLALVLGWAAKLLVWYAYH